MPNFIFGYNANTVTGVYNYIMPFFWLDNADDIYDFIIKQYVETTPFIDNKFLSCVMTGGGHGSNTQSCKITVKQDCKFFDRQAGTVSTVTAGTEINRTYAQPFCCVWE